MVSLLAGISVFFPIHMTVSFEIDPETQFVSKSLNRATRDTHDTDKWIYYGFWLM